jgi:hypothetical protein
MAACDEPARITRLEFRSSLSWTITHSLEGSRPMEHAAALKLSKYIAERLRLPIKTGTDADLSAPLTLAGLLTTAFMLAKTIRRAIPGAEIEFQPSDGLLTAMFAERVDPDAMQKFLYEALLNSPEDPLDLQASIDGACVGKVFAGCRKEFVETINELWPPPPPGRPRNITQADFPTLFERCERLRPLFYGLLQLQDQFPTRNLAELLEFLRADYADEFLYVVNRLPKIAEWIQECSALKRAKTNRARARLLADLTAASDYRLAPHFALQKAGEARRFVVGKERHYKPKLKRVEVLEQLRRLQQVIPEKPVTNSEPSS